MGRKPKQEQEALFAMSNTDTDELAVLEVEETPEEAEDAAFRKKKWRIILEESDNISPGGQFFGVNGFSWLLKPGVEADVPQAIINVLNDAVESIPTVDTRGGEPTIIGYRHRLRFPYRIIKELK